MTVENNGTNTEKKVRIESFVYKKNTKKYVVRLEDSEEKQI